MSGRQEHLVLKTNLCFFKDVCERLPPPAQVETVKDPHQHLEGTEKALSSDKMLFLPYSKGQVLITQFIPTGLHSCANFPCHSDFHPHHSETMTVED
jgi:hypothetical protein